MDKSIMAVEDTREGNEPLVSASNCTGSPIQINSIAIDMDRAMGEMTQPLTHKHFSIRGFAAEMRKYDQKACLPFSSEGGDDMNLPPLPVPKFRCWQCLDCLPDFLDPESGAVSSYVHNTVEEKDGGQLVENIDHRNSKGGDSFPGIASEANQVQTKQITLNNSADENPSTGPYNPRKTSSLTLSDGDIPFSSVPPKRKLKLRSLADIIKEDENSVPAQQIEAELDPQAQLDAPKKGATKTIHRRKKIVLEDEEEEKTDNATATTKRSKGPVMELNNNNNTTSRSIEISESQLERDNSRPLLFDPRMIPMNLDYMNRKNLHRDLPVAGGTSTGDTDPFFKNSLLREQMQSISDMSKGKRVEEGGYIPYTPSPNNDGSLGVCNNNEKVGLDLSLSSYKGSGVTNLGEQEFSGRHTEIPDLNELFVEKTCMTEEPQLPTLHENSDMFASSGKESNNSKTVEVEAVGKASDDIPMEIVELLAMNQQERSLANSRKHVAIHNNNPYMFNSEGSSSVSSSSMGFLNFHASKNCDSNMGRFRQFGPPTADPMNVSHVDLLRPPRRKNMSFDISGLEDQSCKSKNVKRSAYSNDTIPAMQLLSLMDQRNVSGSSFKQFSPCSHHPKDQLGSSSSFFWQRQSNGTNDFPTLLSGARCSDSFSSKNILSLGQVHTQKGNSRPVDFAGPSSRLDRAWRSNPASVVCCTLNRNPADFSAPDVRNEFMISAKDLKLRKRRKRRVGNDLSRRGNK